MLHRVALVVLLVAVGASCTPAAERAASGPPASAAAPSQAVEAPQGAATTAPAHLRVAISAISAIVAPVWVALDEGLYRKYGLEVEFANFDGGTRAVTPIVTGDTPIGAVTAGAVIDARLQGTDLKMFAALFDTYYFQIFSRREVRSPEDMRGRTIAASSAKSASERAAIAALERYGLQLGRDYQLTYVGSQSGRLAALEQGLVDATVISPPFGLRAREAGFVELVDLMSLNIPYGHFVIASSERWAREHPEQVRAFLQAYSEALALVRRDPEATKRAIAKYTQTDEPALLEESYQVGFGQLPEVPLVREEVVRGSMETSDHPLARTTPPQEFYDNRFVQELETAGFYRQLWGH
jgi:NitT/TauT family transport system substrate-binding protein